MADYDKTPRRWKKGDFFGCYFPGTDLNVGSNGGRGTGAPSDVEWIDPVDDISWIKRSTSEPVPPAGDAECG